MKKQEKEKLIELIMKLKQSAISFGVSQQISNELDGFMTIAYENDEKTMQQDTLNVLHFINKID